MAKELQAQIGLDASEPDSHPLARTKLFALELSRVLLFEMLAELWASGGLNSKVNVKVGITQFPWSNRVLRLRRMTDTDGHRRKRNTNKF